MLTVQCDFDDTITIGDLGAALLRKFAIDQEEWQIIDADYHAGRISVEECQRKQYASVRVGRSDVRDFATREVELRPGFYQAVDYCRRAGIRFVVVSNGLDIYIDAILADLGLSGLERYAGHARLTDEGIGVDYFDPAGNRVEENFKVSCLEHLRAANQPVVCIGDSVSDILPALEADFVIARSELLDHFQRNQLPHFAFETFYDVQQHIQGLLGS